MLNRRQLFPLFAGAAAALALPGLARAAKEPATQFRIGWQKGGVLSLAKQQGAIEKRLADRGIAVSWDEFTSGPPLLEALGAGALDFGSTGDVPPLFAQAAGGDLAYVAAVGGGADGSAILVRKDSPINTLADLKGKKVAFKRGSSAHNFIVKALEKGGVGLDEVTQLDLAPTDAAPAFASGQIDAWAIWDPYYAIAVQDPGTRVLATSDGIVSAWSYLLAGGAYSKANPHVVADVIDELKKVGTWSQSHLDETIKAISAATGVPEAIQRIVLTRKDSDLGNIHPITAEALTYQQGLADEFYKLKIVPKQLTIKDIVWTPPAA